MTEPIVTPVEKPAVEVATPAEVVVEKPAEKTVAEVIATVVPQPKPQETVGLDKFLSEKQGRKDAEKALADLKASIAAGATKEEVADDIAAIGTKYGVDPEFLKELSATIESNTEKKFADRLTPLEQKDKEAKINTAFKTAFDAAMAELPEFATVVNADVIKTLSLDPKNQNKTFTQIIEETYGGAVPGKRTIESTKPGGGKEPEPLDVDRARKDSAYFDEVMANPKLKEQYNAAMLKKGI